MNMNPAHFPLTCPVPGLHPSSGSGHVLCTLDQFIAGTAALTLELSAESPRTGSLRTVMKTDIAPCELWL